MVFSQAESFLSCSNEIVYMCSKRYLSIALLFCFLTPLFLKVGILSNYLVQYKYYVEVLCENKNKPELKCNGKCHLAKELKTVEEDPEKPELPQRFIYKTEDIFLVDHSSNFISSELTYNINSYSNYNPPFLGFCFKKKIFQPPELLVSISV
jgi:hypothetical protein